MKKLKLILAFVSLATIVKAQTVSTFWNDPTNKVDDAMVLDAQGNLYGSHYMGSNVYKITPSGVSTIFASGFNTPNGLAFDSQNNLYVCDMTGGRIYKISYSGTFLDTIVVPNPSGIIKSLDSDTMIFSQYQSNIVNKLTPDGIVIPIVSGAPLNGPVGLAYDGFGTLYVANFNDREIYSLEANTLNYIATVPGPVSGWLGFITFAQGHLWGTGYNDHKIYKINPFFVDSVVAYIGTTAGNMDGGLATAQFNKPNGIIPSLGGDSLFISDYVTGRIRVLTFGDMSALNENAPNTFCMYPSPALDYLRIEYAGPVKAIEIHDLSGQLLHTSKEASINVSQLATGIYWVIVDTGNSKLRARFVKN